VTAELQAGAFHNGMPRGAVAPYEYSRVYIPFSQTTNHRFVLIVRDNALRAMFEDAESGRVVSNFVFDLSPYNYQGTLSSTCLLTITITKAAASDSSRPRTKPSSRTFSSRRFRGPTP